MFKRFPWLIYTLILLASLAGTCLLVHLVMPVQHVQQVDLYSGRCRSYKGFFIFREKPKEEPSELAKAYRAYVGDFPEEQLWYTTHTLTLEPRIMQMFNKQMLPGITLKLNAQDIGMRINILANHMTPDKKKKSLDKGALKKVTESTLKILRETRSEVATYAYLDSVKRVVNHFNETLSAKFIQDSDKFIEMWNESHPN